MASEATTQHAFGTVSGVYRAGGSARSVQATLAISQDGNVHVSSLDGLELAAGNLKSVEVSARVGAVARHVTFPDGGDFETPDNDGVDRLLARAGRRHPGFIHGLEGFRPRLIAFVAVALALCYGIYRFAVPALVEVAIAVTPPVVPQLMSKSVMASLDQALFSPTEVSPGKQQSLRDGFAQLVAKAGSDPDATGNRPAYALNFRKGGFIGPNAFALPDGTIVVTDELIELAKDDEEMILGVLGHEIGHVEHHHSLRQLYRAAGVTALIMMIGGDIGAGTEDVLVQGSALLQLSHSRSAEAEADRYGVELMHAAGKDPAAIARFFEVLHDKLGDKGKDDFFSTHPATESRIEETRRLAEDVKARNK